MFSASFGIIVASILMSAIFWRELPSSIPIHFNYVGVADSWVAKNFLNLFFAPIIHSLIFILFVLIYKHPQYTHWPERKAKENEFLKSCDL
jgi:uncharacterized membrane protein